MKNKKFRIEKDSMGSMKVPKDALYGPQTQRAIENFPISKIQFYKDFISAIVIIKRCAVKSNYELNLIDKTRMLSIVKAADKVLKGHYEDHFPVDIFQTGSGTSTNMNVNEVLATLASTNSTTVHPNDHVNMGQSSNDTIPSAINISVYLLLKHTLVPNLDRLIKALKNKEQEFSKVMKLGRTHLQDATPMTLGQEFSGYKELLIKSKKRIVSSYSNLSRLPQGGTAVGTGINSHKNFAKLIAKEISDYTSATFNESPNHFEAQSAQDVSIEVSNNLKALSISLSKISNDIRWLGSGPRSGLGELIIPPVQPGSSIMPGKVNPVICESMLQICAQVIGNDAAITIGGLGSVLELNLMLPLVAHNLLYSINILSNGMDMFTEKLIKKLKVDKDKCNDYIEKSLAMCTSLAPVIGYDKAAEIAYKAYKSGKTIKEIAIEENILDLKSLNKILDPKSMISPK